MAPRAPRLKLLVGSGALGAASLGALALLLSPAVAGPAGRILAVLSSGLEAEREDDLPVALESLEGLRAGLPVFRVLSGGDARPVAHVVSWHAAPGAGTGGTVRLRFEPGEDAKGPWRVTAYPPHRKLGAALAMAVTPEAAGRFGGEVATRLDRLWTLALLPEAERRLPAFLARIDPTNDTEARALLDGATSSVMRRLTPLTDDLGTSVVDAMKREFDLLDRVGLLWNFLRNDTRGLKRKILPVAQRAAQQWWGTHRDLVLGAVGDGLGEHLGGLRAWAGGELFEAARRELVEPVLTAQRERLQAEGEALLSLAAEAFVEAQGGGFRIRFAGLLRAQVLNKRTALLLIEHDGAAAR